MADSPDLAQHHPNSAVLRATLLNAWGAFNERRAHGKAQTRCRREKIKPLGPFQDMEGGGFKAAGGDMTPSLAVSLESELKHPAGLLQFRSRQFFRLRK